MPLTNCNYTNVLNITETGTRIFHILPFAGMDIDRYGLMDIWEVTDEVTDMDG